MCERGNDDLLGKERQWARRKGDKKLKYPEIRPFPARTMFILSSAW